MRKRSMSIAGHRTSIALEPEFWEVLEEMAAGRDISLAQLVAEIDKARGIGNLASAIRVRVLSAARSATAALPRIE